MQCFVVSGEFMQNWAQIIEYTMTFEDDLVLQVPPLFLESAIIIEPRPNSWVNDVVLINTAPIPTDSASKPGQGLSATRSTVSQSVYQHIRKEMPWCSGIITFISNNFPNS